MAIAYLGLGSNLGRREDFLRQAIEALEQTAGRLLKEGKVVVEEREIRKK